MTTDPRVVRCLDGLHYSFALLGHHHGLMHGMCVKIPDEGNALVVALSACWGFIDSLHRAREIAQSIPGYSGRNAELRIFLEKTRLAETYRHYMQHLRQELGKVPPDTFPVWGSVAWVDQNDPMTSHVVVFGSRTGSTSYAGCVFDRQELRFVSKVSLALGDTSFNFDPIYASACRFRDHVVPLLLADHDPPIRIVEKPPIISTTVRWLEPSTGKEVALETAEAKTQEVSPPPNGRGSRSASR